MVGLRVEATRALYSLPWARAEPPAELQGEGMQCWGAKAGWGSQGFGGGVEAGLWPRPQLQSWSWCYSSSPTSWLVLESKGLFSPCWIERITSSYIGVTTVVLSSRHSKLQCSSPTLPTPSPLHQTHAGQMQPGHLQRPQSVEMGRRKASSHFTSLLGTLGRKPGPIWGRGGKGVLWSPVCGRWIVVPVTVSTC